MTPLDEVVLGLVARRGSLRFDEVVELALYHPEHGFYAAGGQAGRRGDFITSPEVGPLFGAVVARALDRIWREMGEPSVFVVVEAGAGPGALARSVLAAKPDCARALRYVMVESSAAQRAHHTEHLVLEDPASAFASLPEPDGDEPAVTPPDGPIAVSLGELPRLPGPCVVLANELLDNLPFGLLERTDDGWAEVRVTARGEGLEEILVPIEGGPSIEARAGARVPVQTAAARWVADARALAGPGGRVIVIDYATTTADLAQRPSEEWLRTYRQHERGGPPLVALGTQDITCEVAIDQLGAEPESDQSQAEWLRSHGIDDLVDEGRRIWTERAHLGDLTAIRARSRINEAEALLDPAGLGAFRVLELTGT